ncbi:MAG: Mrp/NBP35 family ATP-binding protein [Clostridiales bacterium]|nr:Mrp/NBP35 family ATP-binding protein [Clostridiales bacterium]MCF8022092.1 Mrp/NBP35 family ATP-binding protein [Clostridiales bacterium]
MSEEKNTSCSSGQCSQDQQKSDAPVKLEPNDATKVKNMIAVMSGKGGVGKSTVSGLLSVSLAKQGYKVGTLDADITGPSIPKLFGLKKQPPVMDNYMMPVETSTLGIKIISLNLLMQQEDQPVIWRGPILSSAVKQFWTDVAWGELDYLIVDLPPGTGDVPLTVMQSLPLTGFVVVSTPQDLAAMVVKKTLNMANHMEIPIKGMVVNMSYLKCPECGTEIKLYGEGDGTRLTRDTGIPLLEKLPVDPELSMLCDQGEIEKYSKNLFENFSSK